MEANQTSMTNPLFRPIDIVQQRYRGIVLLAVALIACGALAVVLLVRPSYATSAVMNIQPNSPRVLHETDRSEIMHSYEDWMRSQIYVINSYPTLLRAIEIYRESGLEWKLPNETPLQAVDRLRGRLKIEQKADTQIIEISMESRRNEGLAEIVNAVVESYYESSRRREQSVDNFKLEVLLEQHTETQAALNEAYQKLERLSSEKGAPVADSSALGVYANALSNMNESVNSATVRRVSLQNRLNALLSLRNAIRTEDISDVGPPAAAADPVAQDGALAVDRSRRALEDQLIRLGQAHPERRMIEGELQSLAERSTAEQSRVELRQVELTRHELLGKNRLAQIETIGELREAIQTESALRARARSSEARLLDLHQASLRANTTRAEIARLEMRLQSISQRIDEVSLELRTPGRIELVSRAQRPVEGRDRRAKLLILVVAAGLIGACCPFVAASFFDRTLRTAQDVETVAGFPPTLEFFPDLASNRQLGILFVAEAGRGAQTMALLHATQGRNLPAPHDIAAHHRGLIPLDLQSLGDTAMRIGRAIADPEAIAARPERFLRSRASARKSVLMAAPHFTRAPWVRAVLGKSDAVVVCVDRGVTTLDELNRTLAELVRLKTQAVGLILREAPDATSISLRLARMEERAFQFVRSLLRRLRWTR